MVEIELGDLAKDSVTGFKGICVARTSWLFGCVRCALQPQDLDHGKVMEAINFDEPQLVLLKKAAVKSVPAKAPARTTGGPIPIKVTKPPSMSKGR